MRTATNSRERGAMLIPVLRLTLRAPGLSMNYSSFARTFFLSLELVMGMSDSLQGLHSKRVLVFQGMALSSSQHTISSVSH